MPRTSSIFHYFPKFWTLGLSVWKMQRGLVREEPHRCIALSSPAKYVPSAGEAQRDLIQRVPICDCSRDETRAFPLAASSLPATQDSGGNPSQRTNLRRASIQTKSPSTETVEAFVHALGGRCPLVRTFHGRHPRAWALGLPPSFAFALEGALPRNVSDRTASAMELLDGLRSANASL